MVSIIVPCYNSARFVKAAIDSALSQDYKPIEVLAIDDGSTDETAAILASYGEAITVLHQDNAGVSAARNKGFSHAAGEIVVLLDSDDVLLPSCVSSRVELLNSESGVGLVTGLTRYIDERGNPIIDEVDLKPAYPNGISYVQAMQRFPGPPSGWAIPKPVLEEIGGFDITLKTAEDLDLCLRILAKYKCLCDPVVRVLYRQVSGSLGKDAVRNYDQVRKVIRKNRMFAPVAPTQYWWQSRVMMLTATAGAFTGILRSNSGSLGQLFTFLRKRPGALPYFVFWGGRAVYNRFLYMFNRGPLRHKQRALEEQARK